MLMSLVKKNDEILFVFLKQLLVRLINANVVRFRGLREGRSPIMRARTFIRPYFQSPLFLVTSRAEV